MTRCGNCERRRAKIPLKVRKCAIDVSMIKVINLSASVSSQLEAD